MSDTARNFLIVCAETAATTWTKNDQGISRGRCGRGDLRSRAANPLLIMLWRRPREDRARGRTSCSIPNSPSWPDEMPRLREIEDWAGTMFSGLGLIEDALDVAFPGSREARGYADTQREPLLGPSRRNRL